MITRLSPWLPLALWLTLMALFSSAAFSSSHTGQLITPWVHWLSPTGAVGTVDEWNRVLRKGSHLLVYAAVALCWYRGLAARRRKKGGALAAAFILSLGVGVLDEAHQLFVPERTGQASDVLLDGLGAGVGLCLWGMMCRNRTSPGREALLFGAEGTGVKPGS
jgi:VanZ family protein